jgi:tripartite-type tricarboxylate transporter receptor subunit TctC
MHRPDRRLFAARVARVAHAARVAFAGLLTAAFALGPGGPAGAQTYPSGTVRIIVPYGPGAATDLIARLLATQLQAALGGAFIVENKAGAGAQIGTKAVADAQPDGLTLGFIDTAFVINPGLLPNLPYDTRREFAPLSLTATAQLVLSVHRTVPAESVKAFVALAKSQPGKFAFASAGVGSAPHLAGEQFRIAAGLEVNHVAYKGGAAVFTDLLAGHVQFAFTTVPSMVEHIRAGSVRALAVTGDQRSPLLPDVPTMAEAGLKEVDALPLWGLVAPARVSPAILERVSRVASAAVREGPVREKLVEMGFTPVGSSDAEFRTRVDSEIDKWARVIKAANIQPDR